MWFVGMLVGAVIGGIGNGGGIVIGGVVGLILGGVIGNKLKQSQAAEARIATLEGAVKQLAERVKTLESGAPVTTAHSLESQASQVLAVTPPVPEVPIPPIVAEPLTTATAATQSIEAVWAADTRAEASVPLEPVQPPQPRKPSALWNFFFGGNMLVRVGIMVLFIGVAFLLKYATDRGFVPIELRLAGVAAGGIALLGLGWRLRHKRADYALMLQGGGIGVLYLTVFAGLRLYALLPPTLAFILLAAIAFFSALLAIVQDSKALAITGAAGGFLAPLLASTGGGSHVALFSFYAVLNTGILFIAWHKAWRELNLVGFVFTALIGLVWGVERYRAELFATTEPFLILFFLMYVAMAVLFALRRAPSLVHYVDGTIVFGVPLFAFGLQAAMMKGTEFGAAMSALTLAAFYLTLASVLHARQRDTLRLLVESFLALGIGFATLAVPLALDARWTSAVWAVEGAAIVWVGIRQNRLLARSFGMFLQIAAGLAFLSKIHDTVDAERLLPLLNAKFLGCVMVSLAALFINYYAERRRDVVGNQERVVTRLLFVWGAVWWFVGGVLEIERHVGGNAAWNPELAFFALSCAVFAALWQRLDWLMARYAALALLPMMAASLMAFVADRMGHPFASHAYLGWMLMFAVHFWILRKHESPEFENAKWREWWHAAGFWLFAIVASWEFGWQIRYVQGSAVWPLIAWGAVPAALIATFAARGERLGWPVNAHRRAYLYLGSVPLAVFLLAWMVIGNSASTGSPAPLPYVPLVNPLELALFGTLLAVVMWYLLVRRMVLPCVWLPSVKAALTLLGIVVFMLLNGVLLRTLHHYADVPFRFGAMMGSTLVQASLSLFWSLLALAAMFFATKRSLRALWFTGAALLAVVIVKLVLVDLSNTGTVERIVSFIGVGLFCVVIGYFAPVPPKAKGEDQSAGKPAVQEGGG